MNFKSLVLTATLAPAMAFGAGGGISGAPFASQWGLANTGQKVCNFAGSNCVTGKAGDDIKANQAWTKSRDCSNVLVAVLDTGADSTHPDLKGNLLEGKNFVNGANTDDATDDNLHGTHVAGIIAGNGNSEKGINGVCQKAKVMPVKVASAEGYLADSDILQGIDYAVSKGAKVVNGSFGGGPASDTTKSALQKASGTLFVFAAGNGDMFGRGIDNDTTPSYPASYGLPNIVSVAATDANDKLTAFSNYGTSVDVAAPGQNILSTLPLHPTDEMSQNNIPTTMGTLDGTSMATPFVTGAAALYWSNNPNSNPVSVRKALMDSADKVSALNGKVGSGRINLASLLGTSSGGDNGGDNGGNNGGNNGGHKGHHGGDDNGDGGWDGGDNGGDWGWNVVSRR